MVNYIKFIAFAAILYISTVNAENEMSVVSKPKPKPKPKPGPRDQSYKYWRSKSERGSRYLLSHHKSGTVFSMVLNRVFKDTYNKNYPVLEEHFTITRRSTPSPARIVHFVRNPFDMIVSAYLYHKQNPPPEKWLDHKIDGRLVKADLGRLYFGTAILAESAERLHSLVLKRPEYPDPGNMSYNAYLASLDPLLGVRLEYMRSSMAEMNHMVGDTRLLDMINTTNPKGVTTFQVCMPQIMTKNEEGDIINDYKTIRMIAHDYLNLPQSEELENAIEKHFPNKGIGKHATDRSREAMIHREALVKEIRNFDLGSFGGLIHSYEKVVRCETEYNGDKNA